MPGRWRVHPFREPPLDEGELWRVEALSDVFLVGTGKDALVVIWEQQIEESVSELAPLGEFSLAEPLAEFPRIPKEFLLFLRARLDPLDHRRDVDRVAVACCRLQR